jgi:general secretion pathway protein D
MCLNHRISYLVLLISVWLISSPFTAVAARISGQKGAGPTVPSAPRSEPPPPQSGPADPVAQEPPPSKGPGSTQAQKTTSADEEDGKGASRGERYVTIDFDEVEIALFIKFISELTGKNFVLDKAVKGAVTIVSPTKITVDEAYKLFESVLEVHGFSTVPAGNIIKIVPAVDARTKDVRTMLEREALTAEDKVVTQLIHLKYADPEELKKIFVPLISKNSVMVSYRPTGMLIVTDVQSNIRRLLHIISAIDTEGVGEEIAVIPLQHAAAVDTAKMLNELFQKRTTAEKKGTLPESPVKIVADERTNTLIAMASEGVSSKIRKLIELLDKQAPRTEGRVRVYFLQNANAEDLAKVLMAIPTKSPDKGAPQQPAKTPVVSKEVLVVADKATNSLLITASKEDYQVLEEVIKQLDILRRMVYIEALLMEVSVSKDFNVGVRWSFVETVGSNEGRTIGGFGASHPGGADLTPDSSGSAVFPGGFSLGVLGEAIQIGKFSFPNLSALIRFAQTDSDINVLSTPQVMTTDNEEAEISVGEERPFLTRQEAGAAVSVTTFANYNTYERKDVGVKLKITPQINQERFVRLKLAQEVSQVVETSISDSKATDIGLPITRKRTAKTTVIVKDGHTVVIGGLIDQQLNHNVGQAPCLGDVPGLGWLFKSVTKRDNKTNLYIFLTPHIVESPVEAAKVYEEKRKQMDAVKEGVIKMYDRGPPREDSAR